MKKIFVFYFINYQSVTLNFNSYKSLLQFIPTDF